MEDMNVFVDTGNGVTYASFDNHHVAVMNGGSISKVIRCGDKSILKVRTRSRKFRINRIMRLQNHAW